MNRSMIALAAAALIAPLQANAATIYSNDFNSGLGAFTTTGGASILTENGVTYLGNMTQGASASLTLDTSGYTDLTLSFTLYAVASLDGNGTNGGSADPFNVADNSGTIFNYTFANYTGGNMQSYGGAGMPAGVYAPQTGSAACGQLGRGCGDFGDSTYLLSNLALVAGPGGTLNLVFTGNSNQGTSDEFYGIDNVTISGTAVSSAVPEPASWALMIAGMGVVGGVLRRRRAPAGGHAFA